MNKLQRSMIAGTILTLLPIATVFIVKRQPSAALLDTPQSRLLGNPDAKVKIIEYSDFQCPSCTRVEPTIHAILDTYKEQVALIYKFFPLTVAHKNALAASHAAACADLQHQFWPYHDQLFATQKNWAPLMDPTTSFMSIAQTVHLNTADFQACYQNPVTLAPVLQDMADGQRLNIHATPTFFIGDERLLGNVFEAQGALAVERALRKK